MYNRITLELVVIFNATLLEFIINIVINFNILNQLFSRKKSPVPTIQKSSVIYQLKYKDCQKSYVGQTG